MDRTIIIYFDVTAKSLPMDESAAGLLDNADIICHKNFLWSQVTLKRSINKIRSFYLLNLYVIFFLPLLYFSKASKKRYWQVR